MPDKIRTVFKEKEYDRFIESVLRSTELSISQSYTKNTKITHYREFRARFHIGCNAFDNIRIAPLTGSSFHRLAQAAPNGYLESRQILFDVIANTDMDLLKLDFDDPSKSPSAANLDRLTSVHQNLSSVGLSGSKRTQTIPCYFSSRGSYAGSNYREVMREFCCVVRRGLERIPNCADLTKEDVEEKLFFAEKNGSLPKPNDMQQLHAVYFLSALCHGAFK